jgi:hypothetical protein
MTTVLFIGGLWLALTLGVFLLIGRVIREADHRDDGVSRERSQVLRARRRAGPPVRPAPSLPDLAELEAWYRADDHGGADGGARPADSA